MVCRFMNEIKHIKKYIFTAFAAAVISASPFQPFLITPARAEGPAEYMFILKNGSSVTAAVDEKSLLDNEIKVLKIKTAYGELEVPREEIVKYYKSSETVKTAQPEPQAKPEMPAEKSDEVKVSDIKKDEIKEVKKTAAKEPDPLDMPSEPEKPLDTAEVQESVMKMEDGEETKKTAGAKTSKGEADGLLNLDDDKLLDMLGESNVKPPEPVIQTDSKKVEEIEDVRDKYQAKKSGAKKLIPDNLNSIESDIKDIAGSSTEEDWLIAKFTKEIQIEKAGTVPVEVIEVGGGKEKKEDGGTKEVNAKKKTSGTGEVALGTNEVILSETIEAEVIGGGKLSEKIVKELKKHKSLPPKSISEKRHLNSEIEKHFGPAETKPAPATEEVKAGEKKDKKK